MGRTLLHGPREPNARRRAFGRPLSRLMCLLALALAAFVASSAFSTFSSPGTIAEAGDSRLVWKTLESEHFVIHYHEPLDDIARRVADICEYSHQILVPVFDHEPREKTQVVITDDTDSSNGFASVLPRNAIRLFATAPGVLSALNDHDDWLFGLTAHEYTHILHLDSIGGLPGLYNRLFGKTWAPNQVQPRWVIEGIATYQESQHTSGGRIRNALFDMDLRAVTLDDQRLKLDAVTNGPEAWPRGNAAYLYGSHFLKYIFDRFGADKLRDMSWSYGSSPFPYALNRTIKNITGLSFEELYDDWQVYLRDKYSMQLEAIERAGLREGRRLTFSAENNTRPRYTHDGAHLLWRQADGYTEGRFRMMPIGSDVAQAEDFATIYRTLGYDLLPDRSMIVTRANNFRTNYNFLDLYRWDHHTREIERLTRGLRASDASVSPDQSTVAFVANGASKNTLAVMPLQPMAQHRIVWQGDERFDQAGTPYWSPDGRQIAFTAWTQGGYRDIMILDVQTGETRRLMRDRANDITPVFSPDGAYLYYSSDRSGVYNIYARELATGQEWQVTNVRGGAFWPAVSPDGRRLAYQGFGVGGYDIYELELDRATWIEPLPYINDRPDPVEVPTGEFPVSAPRPYRPLATLAPQSYELSLSTTSFGSAVGVRTSGADAVGIHSYFLSTSLGLSRRDINFSASYSYRRLWPTLRLAVSRNASLRSGLVVDGSNTRYTHDVYGFDASVDLPILRTDNGSGRISLRYDYDWLVNAGDDVGEYDPNDFVPRYPEVDLAIAGVGIGFGYSDARSYAHTLGPQNGQSFNLSLRLDHPNLGSAFRSLDLGFNWNGFMKLPWGETPTAYLRLAGGVRTNDRSRINPFVLGGTPQQDLVDAIANDLRVGVTGYLRGYEARSLRGRHFALANLEYRHMLWRLERGVSTLPFYIRRLHLAALVDAGDAWDEDPGLDRLAVSTGAALRLDVVLGYFVPGSFEVGYSRGLTHDGVNEFWTLLTGTL